MSNPKRGRGGAEPQKKKPRKFAAVYPGEGWADNNLSPEEKETCSRDLSDEAWDTADLLRAALEAGYQVTCKHDRGKEDVHMAVMVAVDPSREDFSVWLSMRAGDGMTALARLLWTWRYRYDEVLVGQAQREETDIW